MLALMRYHVCQAMPENWYLQNLLLMMKLAYAISKLRGNWTRGIHMHPHAFVIDKRVGIIVRGEK